MSELDKVFESVAQYFALLAEPARLKILHSLCNGEKSVGEVVEETGLAQANTSRHLNMLYRARVLDRRREGSLVIYRMIDPNFADLCRTVCIRIASQTDAASPRRATLLQLERDLDLH